MGSTIDKDAGGMPLTDGALKHVRELLGYKAYRTFHMLDASRRLGMGEDPATVEGYVPHNGGFRCWDQAISKERWAALTEAEREVWRTTADSLIAYLDNPASYLPWLLRGEPTWVDEYGYESTLDPRRLTLTTNGGYALTDDAGQVVLKTFGRDEITWTFPKLEDPADG